MDTFRILYKKEDLIDKADILADFNYKIGFETENKEMDVKPISTAISRLISSETTECRPFGFYLMAVAADDTPAGWMLLTYEINPTLGGLNYMIQSVYVEKQFRKQGWFRALYQKATELANQDKDCKCLRLYVEHENETAIAVYTKMGMDKIDFSINENDYVFEH